MRSFVRRPVTWTKNMIRKNRGKKFGSQFGYHENKIELICSIFKTELEEERQTLQTSINVGILDKTR